MPIVWFALKQFARNTVQFSGTDNCKFLLPTYLRSLWELSSRGWRSVLCQKRRRGSPAGPCTATQSSGLHLVTQDEDKNTANGGQVRKTPKNTLRYQNQPAVQCVLAPTVRKLFLWRKRAVSKTHKVGIHFLKFSSWPLNKNADDTYQENYLSRLRTYRYRSLIHAVSILNSYCL